MSLIVNGTTIPTSGTPISVSGTSLDKVVCNGVTVWERVVFTTKEFSYTGGNQHVLCPPGLYRLEVWGAQGGNSSHGGIGGLGGYSRRYIHFSEETALYVCVGGCGNHQPGGDGQDGGNNCSIVAGGYNGGGAATNFFNYTLDCGTGGGCTHISKDEVGVLSEFEYSKDKVLIVAGGGGGAGYSVYTGVHNGGAGGGVSGGSLSTGATGGTASSGGHTPTNGYDGVQPDGHYSATYNGSFGKGGYSTDSCWFGGGGGGGWYGGGGGYHANGATGAAGGSGYICSINHFEWNGVDYPNLVQAGQNTGHGKAKITYITS